LIDSGSILEQLPELDQHSTTMSSASHLAKITMAATSHHSRAGRRSNAGQKHGSHINAQQPQTSNASTHL